MKNKDIVKQLAPGVVVGLILGFCLTMIVGINTENPIPNYIGGAMCCFVPVLLNCLIVLKGAAKFLGRKLTLGQAFCRTIPYALIALVFGFMFVSLIVEQLLGINSCEISKIATAIYQAILGVVVSTVAAYCALKKYESQVKYTRRNK